MKPITCQITLIAFIYMAAPQANAQCDPGDTAVVTSGGVVMEEAASLPGNLNQFYKTATDTNERVIFLLPGLGADENSWQDVNDETGGITYEYPLYPPRKAAMVKFGNKNDPGYTEAAGLSSAGGDVYDYMTNQVNYSSLGVTDLNNNIAIGHSQGGLVGRATDYNMRRNGKTPKFGGLVTFGSAHQGAEILTNGLPASMGGRGKLADFATEFCNDLTDGPIYEALSSSDEPYAGIIRLLNLEDNIVDVKTSLCNLLQSDTILLAAMPGLTPPITTDYMATNQYHTASNFLLDTLNNYTPTIPMVAFYGVEEDPVVWRQLGSISHGVHNYPAFQADPDQQYVDDAAQLEVEYYSKYLTYKGHAEWHLKRKKLYCTTSFLPIFKAFSLIKCLHHGNKYDKNVDKRNAFQRGHDFLKQANDKWKAIIGARKTQVSHIESECTCADKCNSGNTTYPVVNNEQECLELDLNPCLMCSYYGRIHTNVVYKESDGVVLVESAKNLPGAVVNPNLNDQDYKLEDTNHQQLRNSSKTAQKLNRLFDTNDYGAFFRTSTR